MGCSVSFGGSVGFVGSGCDSTGFSDSVGWLRSLDLGVSADSACLDGSVCFGGSDSLVGSVSGASLVCGASVEAGWAGISFSAVSAVRVTVCVSAEGSVTASVLTVTSALSWSICAVLSAAHPVIEIRSAQAIAVVRSFVFIVVSPLNHKNTDRTQEVQRESEKLPKSTYSAQRRARPRPARRDPRLHQDPHSRTQPHQASAHRLPAPCCSAHCELLQ